MEPVEDGVNGNNLPITSGLNRLTTMTRNTVYGWKHDTQRLSVARSADPVVANGFGAPGRPAETV
jgi:hypothetical protein